MKEINIIQATELAAPNPLAMVCTRKENGKGNMAPVSFFTLASFDPPMLAFAMGKAANSGENFRRTGQAVLALPGTSLQEAVMRYGSTTGGERDKLEELPIALQELAGLQLPEDSPLAFAVRLQQTIEAGDHYLYLCAIDKIVADEGREALFAWDGFTQVMPAVKKD